MTSFSSSVARAAAIADRVRQELSKLAERWLHVESSIPGDARFASRVLPRGNDRQPGIGLRSNVFFPAFETPETTLFSLRHRWPDVESRTVERARRVGKGQIEVFGKLQEFGEKSIDWQLDPESGRRASLDHWSRLMPLEPQIVGNIKNTWELNRHQYLVTLGKAYWLTREEFFTQVFVRHLTNWIEENPPKRGVNWASSLELSIRAIAWIWSLHFFKDSPSMDRSTLLLIGKLLYLHGCHIERYLSTYSSPNTHLTGEALGLLYLGLCFPEWHCSRRWTDRGIGILKNELARQVSGDGVYFEQSTYYHRYTADFYLHAMVLGARNGIDFGHQLRESVVALCNCLMHWTKPDGTTPLIGDDDGGCILPIGQRQPSDFRGTLGVAAVLFGRADFRFAAGTAGEEILWLFGSEGLAKFDALEPTPPERKSLAFDNHSYIVLRDDWSSDADYLLFHAPPRPVYRGGHRHADALSFELVVRGRTILIDPGSFTYSGSRKWRDYFRRSQAHNVVTVDDRSAAEPGAPFQWKSFPESQVSAFYTCEQFDYISARHNGYETLNPPVQYRREILLLKRFEGNIWLIRDKLKSKARHEMGVFYHFASDITVEAVENVARIVAESNASMPSMELSILGADGRLSVEDDWCSPGFGRRNRALTAVYRQERKGDQETLSVLCSSDYRVRRSPVDSGYDITVEDGSSTTTVLFQPMGSRSPEFHTDADIAWVQISGNETNIQSLGIIGGRSLSRGDKIILDCEAETGFAAWRFGPYGGTLETDQPRKVRLLLDRDGVPSQR